jgi:gliding motility-associated-like protein
LTFNTANVSGGTFSWTGVNGFSSSLQNPTRTSATTTMSGNYSATVTVLGCTSPSSTISATVNPIPSAPTITSNTPICEGATLTFNTANVSGGTFSWTGVNGFSSSLQNPTITTATTASTGNYSATVTVNGCTSEPSNILSATVNPIPSAPTIASNTPICEGATLTFNTANVSGGTFSWTGVNGFSSSLQNPTITTATTAMSGNYSATVTVLGCTSPSSTISATVNPIPSAPTITSNTPICEGTTLTFNATAVSGGTYSWTGVNGFSSSLQNPTITTATTAASGNYSATVTVLGCTSPSSTISTTVNPLPAKPTLTSQTICEGLNATITGPTGTYTYTWQVPTGVTASTTNILNTAKAGTYSLTITDANTCSSEVGSATVTVNPLPAKPTLTNQTICEGATATITGPTGTYTYTWQAPTGVVTSLTNSITTNKAGTYSLTITDANSCNSEVGTGTVVVNALPAKPTLTNPVICEGETASITISTPTGTSSYTYTWTVPTGVTASTTNILSTTKAGTYSLTITDANNCTSEAGSGVVTVNALPTVTITNPSAVCAPGTVDLTASTITAGSTASLTYSYFTNATATSTLTNTTLIGSSGTYYIKGTTASNCSAVNPVVISINPVPTFNVTSPSVCIGSPLKVTANPLTGVTTDYDFTWVVPTGVTNPGNVSNFTTTIAGVYAATIKNKITNCVSTPVNNTVSFYPLPSAAAIVATDNKVVVDKTLNLTAAASGGSSPYSISWIPNPTIYYSISGQENAVFTALKEGKVKFKYQVKDANSCEVSSVEYEITIDPADIILVLPNAFTPNGDNNNDEFKVAASNTLGKNSFKSLEIYNRNGKLMFRTEDITQGWNGRYDNVLQDMGVYFVKLVKLNKDGQLVVETSPIYLLK